MVYNPLRKDCRGVNLPGRSKLRCQQQCVEVEVRSLKSTDVRLFLKEAGEEDDLNHHRNSLIKSDSITATPVPLCHIGFYMASLSGLTTSIYTMLCDGGCAHFGWRSVDAQLSTG